MKNTKILAVLGIILAMGMTACGNSNGESSGQGGKSDTAVPSDHKHDWGEGVVTTEPTCEEKGVKTYTCECGETKTESIKALGHDWGEWSVKTAASCTQDGVEERVCKRAGCGKKEERVVKAAHDWDAEQTVAAGADPADQVAYKLANCKKGDAIKVDITAVDAKFYKGSIKSGTPSGYFKLNSKNDKAYWKFSLAGTKLYKGMLYERGAMDSFSSNTERSYAQTSTSGDHAPQYPLGNFDVKVNGDSLDKSQWIDIPYSELLADGDDSSAMGDNYSPLCLCPIGECVLQPGLNEITYERLGSYNLIISDLIFIGAEYEHVHAAASAWSSDETNHWHACTAPGCPTGKLDVAAHTFGDKYDEVAATCSAKGSYKQKCSVCDYVKTVETDQLAHTYGEPYDIVPATCEAAGSQKRKCSVCDDVKTEVLPKLAHDFSGGVAQSYPAGEGYIKSDAYNCAVCGKSALRWNARDFDTASSSTNLDLTHDGDKSVRFASGEVENKGGAASVGSHIIYKINVGAAVEKAGLSFKIKNTGGSGWGSSAVAPVFGVISGDSSLGAIANADGTFTTATHRYGLKVNGVEYFLGEDSYGNKASVTDWFDWPVEFPLTAGVNTIDVFAYAGYRADLYEFQVTGLPHVEPAHTHVLSAWQSDDNYHWKVCTAEGCLDPEGTKYENAAHDWDEVVVTTQPTCTAEGAGTKECKVCHKVVNVVVPAKGHTLGEAQTACGDAIPHECTVCHAMIYELAIASPAKLKSDITWNVTGLPAGKYDVTLSACAASTTLTQDIVSGGSGRYQFRFGSEGDYVSPASGTYASYGLGTGEKIDNVQWTKPLCELTAAEGVASFTIHYGGQGYSAFIAAIRLVKVA